MKAFAILALTGLVAIASALPQEKDAPSATAELTPAASCAVKCDAADMCCLADCAGVPCPNEDMANETTECAAKCDQGSGSAEDTVKYADCQRNCINTHFLSGSLSVPPVTAVPTGAAKAPTNNASPADAAATNTDESDDDSAPTATGTGTTTATDGESTATGTENASASSTDTGAAIANAPLSASFAGVFALVVAALAL
ncbi:hypothetical protein AJ80_02693 [Polytolypa hystricis UAMH7299]|uniref:Extracellular membrane protein CFEM domain-containing protein n=1 Tax=Polytolypa hystricis (strain UAMH7299) TaxID=1447883 RepID=A0A2B7YRN2_POLH7|nr:hypothetical protein AJ80_02693 [Polytolypa hystricis UAMH7299]